MNNIITHKKGFRLDFRTKLFMTIVISYVLLLGNLQQRYLYVAVMASLLPQILFLLERRYAEAVKSIIMIVAAVLLRVYFSQNMHGILMPFMLFITILALKVLPGAMMGRYTFLTTDIGEMVYCLKKMKLPDQIVIPFTVMARFFYTASIDYSQIKAAMYMHGLTTRSLICNPVRLFEYRIVPLMMSLMRTADEVGISALTRGLRVGRARSSIRESRFSIYDFICFILMLVLIAFYIGGKYAGN